MFKIVVISNNTLTWDGVRKLIKLSTGYTFDVAFNLDPLVLFENSEPDMKRKILNRGIDEIRKEKCWYYSRGVSFQMWNFQELSFKNRKQ